MPVIHESAYVHPSAVVIGKVTIGKNVFVGPNASLRADEQDSMVVIADDSNIQDNVVMHCLEYSSVIVGRRNTLAHNVILHGPCRMGDDCFIGFGSTVFQCDLGDNVIIKHHCCVENITIPPNKLVISGTIIDGDDHSHRIQDIDKPSIDFASNVVRVNLELVNKYKNIDMNQ